MRIVSVGFWLFFHEKDSWSSSVFWSCSDDVVVRMEQKKNHPAWDDLQQWMGE